MQIIDERPEHQPGVRHVLELAFPGHDEADLVDELRAGGHLCLLRVAIVDRRVVGMIAFSTMEADYNQKAFAAYALAPVAVSSDHQRRGIGTKLIKSSLAVLRSRGAELVVVAGDPGFYQRCGFSSEAAENFVTPFSGPACQALWLASEPAEKAAVTLKYAAPFDRFC